MRCFVQMLKIKHVSCVDGCLPAGNHSAAAYVFDTHTGRQVTRVEAIRVQVCAGVCDCPVPDQRERTVGQVVGLRVGQRPTETAGMVLAIASQRPFAVGLAAAGVEGGELPSCTRCGCAQCAGPLVVAPHTLLFDPAAPRHLAAARPVADMCGLV